MESAVAEFIDKSDQRGEVADDDDEHDRAEEDDAEGVHKLESSSDAIEMTTLGAAAEFRKAQAGLPARRAASSAAESTVRIKRTSRRHLIQSSPLIVLLYALETALKTHPRGRVSKSESNASVAGRSDSMKKENVRMIKAECFALDKRRIKGKRSAIDKKIVPSAMTARLNNIMFMNSNDLDKRKNQLMIWIENAGSVASRSSAIDFKVI